MEGQTCFTANRRMPKLKLTLAFNFLFASSVPALCDPPDRLEELFQSETVYPQEKGEFQLTLMPRFLDHRHGNAFVSPVGFEYGLTDSWQVEGDWDSYVRDRDEG